MNDIDLGITFTLTLVGTNVSKVIYNLNTNAPKAWTQIKYTEKEIPDLASMPDTPYRLVDNSWIRVDLIKD